MKATTTSFAAATFVLAAALAVPGSASATYRDTSAGGACQAASGANEKSFNYSNNYVTNIGTTSQFVICHFAMADGQITPTATSFFAVNTQSTQAGVRIVSCSLQTGSFYNGANHIISNNVSAHTYDAVGYYRLDWTETAVVRNAVYDTVTLNCRMDPGTRLGIIEYWD
jgi:hypothetical protein